MLALSVVTSAGAAAPADMTCAVFYRLDGF